MNSLSLNLTLHCGRDLPKADLLSSIDAYAVVIVPIIGGQTKTFKTKCVQDDPNPDWEFDLFCTDVDGTRDCLVEIWDEDTLRNEKVCTAILSLVELKSSGSWLGKHIVLKCLSGFKPFKGAKECCIIVSASAHISFADLTRKITSPNKYVDPSKKTIVFPFSPHGDNTQLYIKISAGKRFKISVLDTSEFRTRLVMFEVAGKNITSQIIKLKEPKKKYGICYYRKIKMKKADIKSWTSVNLLVSNCSLVATKGFFNSNSQFYTINL
ncbi:predicted protein [Naegleria gruberi]|uniref:Predicted protein n=1 Tax=Naegleria gruberi TaxID=5762 RepID=D2W5D3_NAEGR|nr:uncharacterized protein NAEGRDRAFT_76623 [Naegleria gruberi]EFC35720.1 predicted protein [Naegleria gruberi]|eukprot:XP_002668464.1 predicted protein [Naegleria gruberi strain NEG-M]